MTDGAADLITSGLEHVTDGAFKPIEVGRAGVGQIRQDLVQSLAGAAALVAGHTPT
jgi:hypothetical protein